MARLQITALLLISASIIPYSNCFGISKLDSVTAFRNDNIFQSTPSSSSQPLLRSQWGVNKFQLFASAGETDTVVDMGDVGFVLLAGGTGSRMKANMPKQFMTLRGKPVLQHSLDLFLKTLPAYLDQKGASIPSYVVLVMDPKYQPDYEHLLSEYQGKISFANPGEERQGSVENGLDQLQSVSAGKCTYVAVHDSARPLVTIDEIVRAVQDAKQYGASVLGVPCKATIKESLDGETVSQTIPRSTLWEVHTPQIIKIDTLKRGFEKVAAENLEVTDDVSIVEALGETVKITRGEYTNLKITTPEDMDVADAILAERETK